MPTWKADKPHSPSFDLSCNIKLRQEAQIKIQKHEEEWVTLLLSKTQMGKTHEAHNKEELHWQHKHHERERELRNVYSWVQNWRRVMEWWRVNEGVRELLFLAFTLMIEVCILCSTIVLAASAAFTREFGGHSGMMIKGTSLLLDKQQLNLEVDLSSRFISCHPDSLLVFWDYFCVFWLPSKVVFTKWCYKYFFQHALCIHAFSKEEKGEYIKCVTKVCESDAIRTPKF